MGGPSADSVSQWLLRLKSGDPDAAQRLWERYAARLLELAKRRLANSPRRTADEEDVLASVFESLCHGAANGRFSQVVDRDALWWLLMAITKRKAVDQLRREGTQKRGNHGTTGEDLVDLAQLVGDDPTPEFLVQLEEEHHRLLSLLRDDKLQTVAICRLEGYTNEEIAKRLKLTVRSVERKLKLIRTRWAEELGQ